MEAACDAQMDKGKPRKQITSGFSETFAILQCLARCTLKFYLQNVKHKMEKFKNHQRPHSKYRFNIVGHKKALKIWRDSPYNSPRVPFVV
jgi:hypothetical protein